MTKHLYVTYLVTEQHLFEQTGGCGDFDLATSIQTMKLQLR